MSRYWWLALGVLLPAVAARSEAQETRLLAPERIARIPAGERERWTAYIARSDSVRRVDRAVVDAELRTLGRTAMDSAPFAKDDFGSDPRYRGSWWRSAAAATVGRTLLTYQTATGGWSKHFDAHAGPRRPGQSYYGESTKWQYIATIDNHATTGQLRYLLALNAAQPAGQWQDAIRRGVRYLLLSQMPNGCWPQVFPLQGSYHDAITYNDNAVTEVARVLDTIAVLRPRWFDGATLSEVDAASTAALDCLLRTQVIIDGTPTIWGQQHDPLTLAPTRGRSYELASLATWESAGILDYLMARRRPTPRVVEAVRAAAAWLTAHAIVGQQYEMERGIWPGAPDARLWARMYTLDTQRPLFSNRDGIPRSSLDELTDRRTGYFWYGTWPAPTLSRIAQWLTRTR
ncbi:MAG: pectate lyase [Gemmatimonadaceae bacterium]|jgi:PelA/Pel-15E family pectate lyase|nr:pectate lyase [Gemmatimonadaceae bacterium]